jgi:hypothetical protein
MHMTEAEWLACTDPGPMLLQLEGRITDRKLRLYGCGCVRRVWHLLAKERSCRAVEVSERFTDGLASEEERAAAEEAAREAEDFAVGGLPGGYAAAMAATAAVCQYGAADLPMYVGLSYGFGWHAANAESETRRGYDPAAHARAEAGQAALLRELFGPLPFRPVGVPASVRVWNGGTLVRLARAIYDGRRFGDMPVLADALEEAGCDNADLLAHCRQSGEHVRGCWVVDLLLAKA